MSAHKLPVDNHNRLRIAGVVVGEKSSSQQRNPEDAIIIFADCLCHRDRPISGVCGFRRSFQPIARFVAAPEWKPSCDARFLHARERLHTTERLAQKRSGLRGVTIFFVRQTQAQGQNVLRTKAGIDVHEAPHLAPTSTDTLEANNVLTIEPGIYLEGTGGIRIEDLVIVTDGEPEVLSSFPKELVRVG